MILLREILVDALTRDPGWTAKSLDADLLAALNTDPPESKTDGSPGPAAANPDNG